MIYEKSHMGICDTVFSVYELILGNGQLESLFSTILLLSVGSFDTSLNFVLTLSGSDRVLVFMGAQLPVSIFFSTRIVRKSSLSDTPKESSNS